MERDPSRELDAARPRHCFALEAVSLPGCSDDDDELRLPWNPGYVSDAPQATLGIQPTKSSRCDGNLDGRRASWRTSFWTYVRSLRPSTFNDCSTRRGLSRYSPVGILALLSTSDGWGLPDAVYGSGRLGRDTGSPKRAVS